MTSHDTALDDLLARQDGVIARRQVLAHGLTDNDIRRRLRRREWATLFPGIYLEHTGPPLWRQRAWGAVLDAYPAALGHTSALAALDPTAAPDGPIHIVVDADRQVRRHPGVVITRRRGLDRLVLWHTGSPRLRTEEALLDVAASARTELEAIGVLTDAVGDRITTADRLIASLAARRRITRRPLLTGVLTDLRDGSCSVLEQTYLRRVERAHRLPKPDRQAPTTVGRPGFRDLDYPRYGLAVELDGRGFHATSRARDRDLERDLDAAVGADRLTLRLGWGQVFGRPCSTAAKIGRVLRARGWTGTPASCRSCS